MKYDSLFTEPSESDPEWALTSEFGGNKQIIRNVFKTGSVSTETLAGANTSQVLTPNFANYRIPKLNRCLVDEPNDIAQVSNQHNLHKESFKGLKMLQFEPYFIPTDIFNIEMRVSAH